MEDTWFWPCWLLKIGLPPIRLLLTSPLCSVDILFVVACSLHTAAGRVKSEDTTGYLINLCFYPDSEPDLDLSLSCGFHLRLSPLDLLPGVCNLTT